MPVIENVIKTKKLLVSDENPTVVFDGRCSMGIQLKAAPTNSGTIWIGGTDVTGVGGYPLLGGDSLFLPLGDCSQLRALAEIDQELLHFLVF